MRWCGCVVQSRSHQMKRRTVSVVSFGGAPDRNRTCGPLLRRQLLYPLSYEGSWSGRRGSNSRHPAWKASALPTELLPHTNRTKCSVNLKKRFSTLQNVRAALLSWMGKSNLTMHQAVDIIPRRGPSVKNGFDAEHDSRDRQTAQFRRNPHTIMPAIERGEDRSLRR